MSRGMKVRAVFGFLALLGSLLAAAGCMANRGDGENGLSWKFTFEHGKEGWTGDFVDLPVDYEEDLYDLDFGHTDWPEDLGRAGKALMITGQNSSDDLFMYVRRQLTGLEPGAAYQVRFVVEFATNAPKGAVGIGGPPGEAVFVKVGAADEEPLPVEVDEAGTPVYRLSVDKGNQSQEGENALVIGNVAKESGPADDYTYALKTLDNMDRPLTVTADADGNLWVFVGTESGFMGTTTLYYTRIEIILEKSSWTRW